LPSARLFTDLDQLTEGDVFYLYTLGRTLTYEVDQILIVEPNDTTALRIVEGEDYCTLVTCTPYGVNTHRLLVRGHRVADEDTSYLRVTADALRIESVLVAPFAAIPIILGILLWLFIGELLSTQDNLEDIGDGPIEIEPPKKKERGPHKHRPRWKPKPK
jgi:sortase A